MRSLEELMYQMSDFFMAPVLIVLVILFAYSLLALGAFGWQAWQRHHARKNYQQAVKLLPQTMVAQRIKGYPLLALAQQSPEVTRDQLDVAALEHLESVRLVSRLAPMLGLIATMVPMGPALKSLADGDIQGISENLIVAFSAVIFGLVIASITFWIASVKKRWLAIELVEIVSHLEEKKLKKKQEAPYREAA